MIQSNERCYILDLKIPRNYVLRHVSNEWCKNLPEHVRDHLLVAMHTQVVDLVFGVTQGVAKYTASPSNMQTVNDVTNIYNTLAVDLGLALTIHPSEAIIKVMHLKKLIEDYIITQITSVLDHDIFTKTLIERYSSHKQSDESFLFCSRKKI